MDKTNVVHFKVDKSFAELITNIAREKTFMGDFDIKGGLKALTDSFSGMDAETAFRVLVGDKILFIDEATQGADVVDSDQIHTGFYSLDNMFVKTSNLSHRCKNITHYLNYEVTKIKRGSRAPYFDVSSLRSLFEDDDSEEVLEIINEEFAEYRDVLKVARIVLKEVTTEFAMLKYLQSLSEKYGVELTPIFNNVNFDLPQGVLDLHSELLGHRKFVQIEDDEEEEDKFKALHDHLDAALKISEASEKGIEPVDPKEKKWDAGYISPDGLYYALDGEISNMLHLSIADMLVEAKIIPEDFDGEVSSDVYLEKKGWVKQHGDHILYAGYDNHKTGGTDIPISKAQLTTITTIIRFWYNGIIWPGFNPANRCSVLSWARSEPLQFRLKWFAW